MTELIEPGGGTAYPHGPGPDNLRLPEVSPPGEPPLRFRDLPPAEQLRRKVEDTLRFYAQRHGRLLTLDAIMNYKRWPDTHRQAVQTAMHDPVTIANLRGLGIFPDGVETWDEATRGDVQPTKRQMDALDAVFERIDPHDPRPLAEILREHKIDAKTWNGWLTDPVFAAYVRDRSVAVFGARAHEVDIALMRRAVGGDVQAMKLILELQGRIKQGADQLDANALLARVIEILQVEITDRDTLVRIATRLEALSQQQAARPVPTGPRVIAGELG